MHRTLTGSLTGALLIVACAMPGGAVAAPGPKVTVRVEGKTHELLAPTAVRTQTGWITKGGAPVGACPATSAAGALDRATHHSWGGKFYSSFGDYLINMVLGETQSTSAFYWGIWIDNRYATSGACKLKLRPDDQLLFAVDSVAHHEHPIQLTAPQHASRGHSFSVKAKWFSDAGVGRPLAGARVSGNGVSALTNSHGVATIVAGHDGTLVLHAAHDSYIRAAPVRVRVSG